MFGRTKIYPFFLRLPQEHTQFSFANLSYHQEAWRVHSTCRTLQVKCLFNLWFQRSMDKCEVHYWFSSILTSSKQRTDINRNLIPQMLLQKDIITNLTFPFAVTQQKTSNCCFEPWQRNSSQTYALIGPAGHNFNRFCDVEEYRAKYTKAA